MIPLYTSITQILDRVAAPVMTSFARLMFAGILFLYFWNSAMTKLGDGFTGLWKLSIGAYAQIFPKAFEAVGYDASALPALYKLVALAGTWAEIVLPILIVLGLLTRLSAIGMIGFIAVQSLVDVTGHGLAAADIGKWFDRDPSSILLDQRMFWAFLLLYLVMRGAGPISLDALLWRHYSKAS